VAALPDPPDAERALRDLRVKVLMTALTATALLAPLLGIWMGSQAAQRGGFTPLRVAMCAYTLLFPLLRVAAPRMSLTAAGTTYLALMIGLALIVELRGGISAAVASAQLIVIVLSALIFGARGAAVGLGVSLLGMVIAASAVLGGHVPPILVEVWDPQRAEVWIRSAAALLAFGGAAALAIVYMVAQLEDETALLRDVLLREREQRAALERAGAEAERTRRALAEAERVEALGRLASGVAHDFNNLLTVIVGASEVAQLSAPRLPPEASSSLNDILRASGQAAELTRSLLMLGRRDITQPRTLDLTAHVQHRVGTIRRLLPSDIELSVAASERACILIDPTQLDRVLLNLVANARDAIDHEGKIEIGCEPVQIAQGAHTALGEGSYVALSVRDNGCGMDAETQQRIFEPFFTTKSAGEGTGIGLATVESFARSAGGGVKVESKPGSGTTITVYLPESASALVEEVGAPPPPCVPARGESRSILVVEDNAAVRAATVKMLERAGFQVLSAGDGDRALALVEDARLGFDLLCIDGVLPGARTATVIERARSVRPSMAIVVCSGYVDEDLLRRGIQAGEYACVRKPYTAAQLVESVRRALDAR
jgi:signal transduction histidine kinase/ActR/RegA family two-component response regulator